MRARLVMAAAVLALVSTGLVGCSQINSMLNPPPKIEHKVIAAKVAAPGATVSGKLAKGIPDNLPLWPDASVDRSAITKGYGGNAWTTKLVTPDPYADVVVGTVTGFQKAGWTTEAVDVSSANESSTVITVSAGTGEGVVTITSQKDKKSAIAYVMQKK
jgi:hypothetical protein